MSCTLTRSAAEATAFFYVFSIPNYRFMTLNAVMQAIVFAEVDVFPANGAA